MWMKVGVDVVYMPVTSAGYGFIVFARDDLSGWVEGRAIKAANSENVARFIYEDVICRHGCPARIVMDGGAENMDLSKDLLEDYGIQRTVISPYHPQANGLVERGHEPIVNSLAKYSIEPGDWVKSLPLALWADRISVRRSTGYSAFELVYGRECLLPVELSVKSWGMVDWDSVKSREDLLLARMRQLDEGTLDLTQAADNLRNSRKANKAYFDEHNLLRPDGELLQVGDLVLLFDSPKFKSGKPGRGDKLDDRWIGPYRISKVGENSTFYWLEELDGTPKASTTAGNRIRKFFYKSPIRPDRGDEPPSFPSTSARRRARVDDSARLQELLGMIDDARDAGDARVDVDVDVDVDVGDGDGGREE